MVSYIDFLKIGYLLLLTHTGMKGLIFTCFNALFVSLFFTVEAAGGKALPCIVDVRDEEQISSAVEKAVEKFGGSAVFLK